MKNGIALPNGTYVKEYQVDKELGTGSFGVTYLAIDTHLDRYVAIKEYLPNEIAIRNHDQTISPKSRGDHENFEYGLDRFIYEAQTLARFNHPNIVRITNFFEANNTAYIVMDYEEGEDLEQFIQRKGTLSNDEVLSIILPVLDGLRELHKQSYLHRDIKPSNIYIRTNEIPMLIDFGATRYSIGVKSKSLSIILTEGYAPKEQYNSRAKQEPYTDFYAVGAVMHKVVTGKVPIAASTRSDAITDDEPDPHVKLQDMRELNSINENLKKAIDWALEFKPKDRPQNARVLQDALLMTQSPGESLDTSPKEPKTDKKAPEANQKVEELNLSISSKEAELGVKKTLNYNNKEFTLVIPKGIKRGQRLRVKGYGKHGDLYVKVNNIFAQHDKTNQVTIIGNLMWQDVPYTMEETKAYSSYINNKWFGKKEEGKALKWDNANSYAHNLNLGDYDDWRLPTTSELNMLFVNQEYLLNKIPPALFWSSEKENSYIVKAVDFSKKSYREVRENQNATSYTRCVRNIKIK